MGGFLKNKHLVLVVTVACALTVAFSGAAQGQKEPKVTKVKDKPVKKDPTTESAEPDKILYDRAMASVKKGRYTEGRLDFQTLINTYPDSEYLAKAKLGVADSFYKEGGTSSLTQAIEEYKNFIVFFPFLDEAAYAQMQVGMAHYKLMEKADRDNSHAEAAEDEFRTFLMKYPQSPYVPQAEQSMRNVQEVLAQGDFEVARFYYLKKDYRASAARLVEVSDRYPLFSDSDMALWMLGDIYMRSRAALKNEEQKGLMTDLATRSYDRIVQNYPLSSYAAMAKQRLKEMNMPIPAADPKALERMKQQQLYEREHHQPGFVRGPMNMVKSSPDFSTAARNGAPNLAPPDEIVSAMDVLTPTSSTGQFNIRNAGSSDSGAAADAGAAGTADSESVVTSDSGDSTSSTPANATPTGTAAAQVVDTGTGNSSAASATDSTAAPAAAAPVDAAPATAVPVASGAAPAAQAAVNSTASGESSSSTAASQSGQSTPQPSQAATGTAAKSGSQDQSAAADPNTESTSKKKKGLHKIIPF